MLLATVAPHLLGRGGLWAKGRFKSVCQALNAEMAISLSRLCLSAGRRCQRLLEFLFASHEEGGGDVGRDWGGMINARLAGPRLDTRR